MPAGDKSPYPDHAALAGICSRTARRVIPPLSVLHDHDCIRAASPVPVTTLPPCQFVKYRRLTCFLFGHKYCPVLCSAFRGASAHGYLALIPALGLLVDLLKAAACQFIVLHHLCFYGPMADHARPLAPALIDWLADPARMAVQVFLVVAGFLAAQSLSRPQARWRTR